MKRTPLRRKTPLKRKGSLKKASPWRSEWMRLYKEAKLQHGNYVRSAMSGLLLHVSDVSWHHPFGRVKERIMAFLPLTRAEHAQIHDFGSQSFKLGWLQPEHYGRIRVADWPRPWKPEFERFWPEKLKRTNPEQE